MNIFIASLPFSLEETEIKEIFEDYGQVTSVKLITDRDTGRSKGYGFIEMPNEEEALKAIEVLNGTEIYQRNISVSKAQEKKDNNNRRGGFGGGNTPRGDYRGGGYNKGGYNKGGGDYNRRGSDRGN
jgi:RNA recognition motif-containing protein